MHFKPDITYSEVSQPLDLWCDCGHFAKQEFKRGGPDSMPEPTKFFQISTAAKGLVGVYCEPCLIVANYAARCRKHIKKEMEGE